MRRTNIILPKAPIKEIQRFSFVGGYDGYARKDGCKFSIGEDLLDYSMFLYYLDQFFLGKDEKIRQKITKELKKLPPDERRTNIQGRINEMIKELANQYVTADILGNKKLFIDNSSTLGKISSSLSYHVLNFMLKLNGYEINETKTDFNTKKKNVFNLKRCDRIEQKYLSKCLRILDLQSCSTYMDYMLGKSNESNDEQSC